MKKKVVKLAINTLKTCIINNFELDVCVTAHHQYNDVSNQQDATTFSFVSLFKSALNVSGDKLTHSQEHFLTVYTAFDTMHRRHGWDGTPRSSISTVAQVGRSVGVLYQKLLRMGEFVARNA